MGGMSSAIVSRQMCLGLTLTVLGPVMTTCLVSAAAGDVPQSTRLPSMPRSSPGRSAVCPERSIASARYLNNLITLWAEGFRNNTPTSKFKWRERIEHGPPALIENTAQLGPMSRTMKSSEVDAFEASSVTHRHPVAVDALALFVNKDNPTKGLTIEVDALFSKSRRQGHHGPDPLGHARS